MAQDFLTYTGLEYYDGRLKNVVATKTELQTLQDEVDDIIAEGGEPNVIETVKVNGTALTPDAQKAVDVTVPTATSDLTNDGDGTSDFATEAYVDQNGGKIDSISIDGTAQTIDAQKNVALDLSAYAKLTDLPEDLSDLTNTGADPYAKQSDVTSASVGALKPKGSVAFASLPSLTAANLNNMYSVSDAFTTTADFIEGAGKSYPAGTNVAIINDGTDASPVYKYDAMVGVMDMSAYWTSTSGQNNSLIPITTAQIDALFA